MKAKLIEALIVAHRSGDEGEFYKAIVELTKDEEIKGNVALATQLNNAYKGGANTAISKGTASNTNNSNTITSQAYQQTMAPRDKDSMLELYEILRPEIKLNDVILTDRQKEILQQTIQEIKGADELLKNGLLPTNRILLCGPPGCGKTLTAQALANELNLPMAYVRLDGLVSSYLGQTSINLRKVFDAVKGQNVVLFLDEFDAIAKKRDDSNELGELKRVVTTLLQNFDNMPPNVFLIAATNHQHLLDPAIWRRFNLAIMLELPTEDQREKLLTKWIDEMKVVANLNIKQISQLSEGLNCAQIKELVLAAAKKYFTNKQKISNDDIISILFQQLTLYSGNSDEMWNVIRMMKDRGISLRILAKATSIPHSTLNYRLNKNSKEVDTDEQQ